MYTSAWGQYASQNQKISGASCRSSCVILTTYYDAFLNYVYATNPILASQTYEVQKQTLTGWRFGDSDYYSYGLQQSGWFADELIVNCVPLQEAWAHENNCHADGLNVVIEQLKRLRPTVIYIHVDNYLNSTFIDSLKDIALLVVAQHASPIPSHIDFKLFDVVFTAAPHLVKFFRAVGATCYYVPLAFDARIASNYFMSFDRRSLDVSFVGGITGSHAGSIPLLESLAEHVPLSFWGYGAELLPTESALRTSYRSVAWGREMFKIMAYSKIAFNRHIDMAENFACNMRMYEATGCGALLVTDYKDNLNELFEIDKEVIAYSSAEECIDKVRYFLRNPDKAEKIARAGQDRTLRDHTYTKRMHDTAVILERHIRYKSESEVYQFVDVSDVSSHYSGIERGDVQPSLLSAWQNEMIPVMQRALVQQSLHGMFHGSDMAEYRLLAETVEACGASGRKLLEIGCSSGYCYEIIEYLLGKKIDYTGVDYSEHMIIMARDYYPEARFDVADGAALPFEDSSFPLVISGCVLLHTSDYVQHITETCRVASEWVILSRTPICRARQTQYFTKNAYGVKTVELRFNEQELLGLMEQNGFECVKTSEYMQNHVLDQYEATYLFKRRVASKEALRSMTKVRQKQQMPTIQKAGPVVLVSRAIAFTFPLSYAYLAGQLRAQGEDVRILFKDVSAQTLVKQIMDLNPLIVGFGSLYPELAETKVLIKMLDAAGRKFPIVIGGQMVSPTPEFAVRITGADFGVIGEGELVLAELVQRLKTGQDVSDLKGLVVRCGNDIKSNGPGAVIENLSNGLPAIPYDLFPTDQWLPIGQWYAKHMPRPIQHWQVDDRVINVHGGRGCPFSCNFCYHHSKPRYRNIDVMMEEAQEALQRFDGNMLYFSDDLVIVSPQRAKQLVDAISRLDRPVSFQISTRFDILSKIDNELLIDLKKVGCRSMGIGLESGSDRILKIIGKKCTSAGILEGLERLRQVGIYPTTCIMIGQYSETLEDVVDSINLVKRTVHNDPYLDYAFSITTPFPGSKLYSTIFEKGLLKSDLEFYEIYFSTPGEFKQVVNLSAMNDDEVKAAYYEIQRVYDEERSKSIARLFGI